MFLSPRYYDNVMVVVAVATVALNGLAAAWQLGLVADVRERASARATSCHLTSVSDLCSGLSRLFWFLLHVHQHVAGKHKRVCVFWAVIFSSFCPGDVSNLTRLTCLSACLTPITSVQQSVLDLCLIFNQDKSILSWIPTFFLPTKVSDVGHSRPCTD